MNVYSVFGDVWLISVELLTVEHVSQVSVGLLPYTKLSLIYRWRDLVYSVVSTRLSCFNKKKRLDDRQRGPFDTAEVSLRRSLELVLSRHA